MELKKISIPIILLALSVAFLLTSLMVYLHRGKSAKWVARKMRLGGLMLSLSAILSACDPTQSAALTDNNPPWTCYITVPVVEMENRFYIDDQVDSMLILNLPLHNRIKGEIRKRTLTDYSYAVYNSSEEKILTGEINATDGEFNEETEKFNFEIDNALEKGDYLVRFFYSKKDEQPDWSDQYINVKIN